ncbi:MAG TPA: HAD-IC family P-type ATPase, partial [Candidatus Kapabacteria bacterium]|nr:HAD-IC family P-type ATPase [Candidatus Kapabacteria bacterium]
MEIKSTIQYKGLAPESVFAMLQASDAGLSSNEAANRLRTFGANEIVEKRTNPFLEFIGRYWGPMPWLLELAIILSFVLGHTFEGIIIFVLLTVNAVIGGMHSRSSQKAIELLKQKLAVRAKLLRDGQWKADDAKDIVPGDIFVVKLGDIIPADALVIDGEIAVDESALTGESLPLEAHRSSVVYSGSITMQGEAKCVAVNTGANTYFGRTAELVKIAKPKSHQEEIMMAIVKYMMYVGIAALFAVLIYGFAIGMH